MNKRQSDAQIFDYDKVKLSIKQNEPRLNRDYFKKEKAMKTLMNSYQTTANRTLKGNKYPKQKKVEFAPREYGQWKIKL